MNYVVPNKTKVTFQAGIYIENSPVNLDKIITFEKDIFNGITVQEVEEEADVMFIGKGNNMATNGSINNSVTPDTYSVGQGRPAITFKHGDDNICYIQWVFMSKPDRDNHYEQLVEFVSKQCKMVISGK